MLLSARRHLDTGAGSLRTGGGCQRLVGLHSGSGQRFARQIEPAEARVLVDITQDVGELERAAKMMGKLDAAFVGQAENAHRKPPDDGRHAIAIEVQRRPVRSADVLLGVHRHAVDYGVEIFMLQMKAASYVGEDGEMRRRLSGKHRGNVGAPLVQLVQALNRCGGPAVVGYIVDFATEAVDREHRLALTLRQNAHGGIEGAVRHRRRLRTHAVAFVRTPTERIIAEPRKRAAPSPPTSAKPALLRWTRSLNGSRVSRSRARRRASAWIAASSAPSRTSWICKMSGAPRATSSLVRAASSASVPRKGGGAFGVSSISAVAPCAASVSSGR